MHSVKVQKGSKDVQQSAITKCEEQNRVNTVNVKQRKELSFQLRLGCPSGNQFAL